MTRTETLRLAAPAKVNLFLHVGAKRADGFHALQSLVAFTATGDELAFAPARDLTLQIGGPFAAALAPEADNLVLKAGRALAAQAGIASGAAIVLTKNLPVALGIGGGSADCAAALRGLSQLWDLKLPPEILCEIAAALGSDVPVCVASTPQWMEGRGEVLTPLHGVPALPAVLVNPGVAVPTGKVFAALATRRGTDLPLPPRFAGAGDLIAYLKTTANDLEAPARQIAPAIGEVLDLLAAQEDVLLARMSGSGATCFALFGSEAAAASAARRICGKHAQWWISATRLARNS
jgi:4-diphosphocytidyl-2-C-methyl-D-erythritol kinase